MGFEHRIKRICSKENYIIVCEFENGVKKKYNINILIEKYPIFKKLKEDKELFNKVKVDIGGYGISWNDELDLSAEGIWENGEELCP